MCIEMWLLGSEFGNCSSCKIAGTMTCDFRIAAMRLNTALTVLWPLVNVLCVKNSPN